jgi:hypothetical protein
MSKKYRFAILSLFLFAAAFLPASAKATTYYIDWQTGSDANNGTSKASPWKRDPYMNGFTGSYGHVAGDRFIFKGGVTWPAIAFPMDLAAGGASGNRDLYGTDTTWFTGAAFTRPIFDFQFAKGPNFGRPINVAVSFVNFDNLELRNFFIDPAFGYTFNCMVFVAYGIGNITLSNSLIHDWTTNNSIDGHNGAVCGVETVNTVVDHSTIYNSLGVLSTGDVGACVDNWITVQYSTIHDCVEGIFGASIVHDNLVYKIQDSFDQNFHENAVQFINPAQVYNNVIHDCNAGTCVYFEPRNTSDTSVIYNNVIYNSQIPAITIDPSFLTTASLTVLVYNNTCDTVAIQTSPICIRNVDRGTGSVISRLEIRNNNWIGDGGVELLVPSRVTTLLDDHNVVMSEATAKAQGYSVANLFAPLAPSNGTANMGVNLSSVFTTDITGALRPRVGTWDVGAHQFVTTSTRLNPPTNIRVEVH